MSDSDTHIEPVADGIPSDAIYSERILDEIAKNESSQQIGRFNEIEDRVEELEEALKNRLSTFCAEDAMVEFAEMFVFRSARHFMEGRGNDHIITLDGDENPIVIFAFDPMVFRKLLALTLGGDIHDGGSSDVLTKAEQRLFMLLLKYLSTAVLEATDAISRYGLPKKPRRVSRSELDEAVGLVELVCLEFMFETGGIKSSMIIAVPIQAFEPVFDDKKLLGQKDRRDSAVVWKAKLFDQIENIQVPVTIELGSTELPLATVEGLQVGDELVLPVKNSNLNVFVEGETHLLNGAVEVVDNGFKLRISNAEKSQG